MSFFGSEVFWILWGIVLVVIGLGFKTFAEDRGWKLTWWKWTLAVIWYVLFIMNFYLYGTLVGEFEASAGLRLMLLGLLIMLVLGVGLWRLLALGADKSGKGSGQTEATGTD